MAAPPFLLLLLGGLWLQPARAGSHSLRYFQSSLSQPLPGVPQFSEVGYMDDIPICSYTSESRRLEPRAPWMERITIEDPQHWERETGILRWKEQEYITGVRILMERVNQTRGLHAVQRMIGCELRDDGSIGGFLQYAFNGHDFISLDKDRLTYIAAMDAAKITQDRWNSERSNAQQYKDYLEGECIEDLKKYLKLGAESLQRVTPKIRISRRKSGERIFLTGYAYGFYPRDIEVKWLRNGEEIPWESRDILPSPEGTYQVRITVEIQEGDENTCILQVDHSGLPETVTVVYEAETGSFRQHHQQGPISRPPSA
ncbi:major histocompatibility complex class I-related gene protein-like [Pleurodeles waltl]|uniref:major histocompatibility complex class I-related gene protein-like n=1 Tax=Pleurodeles waltl TaxID=8319 RepID=UPI0037094F87